MPLVEIRDVTKTFQLGEVPLNILRGVSMTLEAGEFVALIGASGSGKTTLMNIIGCLDRPSTGEYLLNGQSVGDMSSDELAEIRQRSIGFVFQNFNLLRRTSALENVMMPLMYSGRSPDAGRAEARELLVRLGLGERLAHEPAKLSGGQQQRVAIARALINHPKILLADEPTGNLDSATSEEVLTLIETLNREAGITVLIVTHEPDIAARAQRIIRINDGRIAADSRGKP